MNLAAGSRVGDELGRSSGSIFHHHLTELRQRRDVVRRGLSARNAWSLYLNRRDAQSIPGGDLRVCVITNNQHLTRLERVREENLREYLLLPFSVGLVDRIDVDALEK